MSVTPIAPEQFEEVQRSLREDLAIASRTAVANAVNALHIAAPEILHLHGRCYTVHPISALDGLELMKLAGRLEAAASGLAPGAAWREYRAAYTDIIRLLWRLTRPRGWRGLLARMRPNPFRSANFAEVRDATRFFGRLQTKSSVHFRFQHEGKDSQQPTTWN